MAQQRPHILRSALGRLPNHECGPAVCGEAGLCWRDASRVASSGRVFFRARRPREESAFRTDPSPGSRLALGLRSPYSPAVGGWRVFGAGAGGEEGGKGARGAGVESKETPGVLCLHIGGGLVMKGGIGALGAGVVERGLLLHWAGGSESVVGIRLMFCCET